MTGSEGHMLKVRCFETRWSAVDYQKFHGGILASGAKSSKNGRYYRLAVKNGLNPDKYKYILVWEADRAEAEEYFRKRGRK